MKQELPNSTLILVFGILSIVMFCVSALIGLPLGIIALVLAAKAKKLYIKNPSQYVNYGNVTAGKILGIIGIVINSLYLLAILFLVLVFGSLFWGPIISILLQQEFQ